MSKTLSDSDFSTIREFVSSTFEDSDMFLCGGPEAEKVAAILDLGVDTETIENNLRIETQEGSLRIEDSSFFSDCRSADETVDKVAKNLTVCLVDENDYVIASTTDFEAYL